MVIKSVFARQMARARLPSVGQRVAFREVASEDELRAALAPDVAGATYAALRANYGRRIVITAPIVLRSTIVVPSTLPGTRIESHGGVPIMCGTDGIDAFQVDAVDCSFDGLQFFCVDGGAAFDAAFVVGSAGANNGRIARCVLNGCGALVENQLQAQGWLVDGNKVATVSGDNFDCVNTNGIDWRIVNNGLLGSGTGAAVVVAASGGYCVIGNNYCATDAITTDLSGGGNTIVGNARCGTITSHGGAPVDTVGNNT